MITAGALWIIWCAVHSLLITTRVQQWVVCQEKAWRGLYRLGYVCFSMASLACLILYTASLRQHPLTLPGWMHLVQALLFVYALVMFIAGAKVYDLQTFLGIRQWQDFRAGRESTSPHFVTAGVLRYVRHPWYSGGIALLWSVPGLTDLTLLTRTILSCYLLVGTILEENKLKKSLGESYRSYCLQVPMLIPWRLYR
jgi:protein-S-isoprenylcysteine O-methyltransferase Ste14